MCFYRQCSINDRGVRIRFIVRRDWRVPKRLITRMDEASELTKHNKKLTFTIAFNYGGRAEIVRMVQELAEKIKGGIIDPQAINEDLISDHLYTRDIPDPDLLIRTSGEMRISNFLLWQIAYTELFVTTTLWPDFSKEEFLQILKDFQVRVRRFGTV